MATASSPLRACIVGCGAIGGWLAASLASAGCKVSVLARGVTLDALRRDGLVLDRDGESTIHSVVASDDPAELGGQDHVIIALKAQTLPSALASIVPLVGPGTRVVTAMNGIPWWYFAGDPGPLGGFRPDAVDPGGAISAAIPGSQVIGGVVHASARVVAPARIELIKADRLLLGVPFGTADAACTEIADAFRRGGINALKVADIRGEIWSKLWGNAAMNPLSVLTGATVGAMLDNADVRTLTLHLMEEMAALGRRAGLDLPGTPEERMAVTRRLGNFKTSMLQDYEAGRPLEVEPILGALAEMADRLGEGVPVIRTVLGLTRLRAATAMQPSGAALPVAPPTARAA